MKKEDQQLIGPIAAFIGARLQYPCPEVNGQGNPWVSTIEVAQHKEKFFGVRVYCRLACPELVQKKWDWLRQNKDMQARLTRRRITQGEFEGDEPTDEFRARCLLHDAIHYRKVYMEMVQLRPDLREPICWGADRVELLQPTIEDLIKRLDEDEQFLKWNTNLYQFATREALDDFFKRVYDPHLNDKMEWID